MSGENLEEKWATGEKSMAADPVTGAGGAVKKRKADLFKAVDTGKPDNIEKFVKTPQGTNDAGLHEMLAAVFGDTELTEDFKSKASTLFEAAVGAKVADIQEQMNEAFEAALEEETTAITEALIEQIDAYMDYAVSNWMEENKIALETGYKVQVAESLLTGMKGLLEAHNLNIDEDDLDVIADLEEQVAEAKATANKAVNAMIAERAEKHEVIKEFAIASMSEGMVDTDAAKFAILAENVAFTDTESFVEKLETIRESYFGSASKPARGTPSLDVLEEEVEEPKAAPVRADMSAYVSALSAPKY